MSNSEKLTWKLAVLAHEEWCQRMIEEGWRPGTAFDPTAHTHDALVPFDRLNPVDRRAAYIGIVAADCVHEIETAIDYSRGRDRELGVADLRVDMRVQSVDTPEMVGTVETWLEDPHFPGSLITIRVRWDSGEVIEQVASECEIRPAESLDER